MYVNDVSWLFSLMPLFLNIFNNKTYIILTFPLPIADGGIKINLNFYFRTFLWCLKRFYEGRKGYFNFLKCTG